MVLVQSIYFLPSSLCLATGYPDKQYDTIPIEIALDDNGQVQQILGHLFSISEAREYAHEFYITYMIYEQYYILIAPIIGVDKTRNFLRKTKSRRFSNSLSSAERE